MLKGLKIDSFGERKGGERKVRREKGLKIEKLGE